MRAYQDKADSTTWGGQNVFDVYSKSEGDSPRRHEVQGLVDERAAGHAGAGRHGPSGFTLMEMMIVMVLIVILAGIGLAMYGNSVHAREGSHAQGRSVPDARRDRPVLRRQEQYPANLDALVGDKYLRAVPIDPFTRSTDSWQTTMSEPDPGNPSLESGISNVKSGSDQTGLDGTRYAEW